MTFLSSLLQRLPDPCELRFEALPLETVFVGVAGFEDRSLSVLREARLVGRRFASALAIEYLPFDEKNRKQELEQLLCEVGIQQAEQRWVTYNRYEPESFEESLNLLATDYLAGQHLLVDISGMSKMLITVLLENLTKHQVHTDIAYAEAKEYHPSQEKYEASKLTYAQGSPDFLTTDVYKNVTTKSLSTVAMQGYPIAMIAFPTFNRKDLMSILNELSPQRLILMEGTPHENANSWRIEAIREINQSLNDYITPEFYCASTFYYKETIERLEEVYLKYSKDHKVIISPTGSKLQTVAVVVFRKIHPDVQIIYPVTRRFEQEYTDGHESLWMLSLGSASAILSLLASYRYHALDDILRLINVLERGDSEQ